MASLSFSKAQSDFAVHLPFLYPQVNAVNSIIPLNAFIASLSLVKYAERHISSRHFQVFIKLNLLKFNAGG